jgi:hypothetical protein
MNDKLFGEIPNRAKFSLQSDKGSQVRESIADFRICYVVCVSVSVISISRNQNLFLKENQIENIDGNKNSC